MAASIKKHSVAISIDAAHPNVYFLDRYAKPILVQINLDQYELRQGRCLLGIVAFYNANTKWGWRFTPHQYGKRSGRILHPNPETAVRRFVISEVYPLRWNDLAKD